MPKKKILLASIIILLSMLACQSTLVASKDSPPPKEVYMGLRNIWFTTKPEDLGIVAIPGSTQPYAIVMDMGINQETATFVSSIAGDGSMYTSTGGGVIGGIGHESVHNASIHFVEVAAGFVDRMVLVTDFPLPADGNVRFYVITPGGVYTAEEVNTDILASGNHELSPLFTAGNEVITQIRIVSKQ